MRSRWIVVLVTLALVVTGCARRPAAQAPPAPTPQPAQFPATPAAEATAPSPQAEKPPTTQEQPPAPESQTTPAQPSQPEAAAPSPAPSPEAATPGPQPPQPAAPQPAAQPPVDLGPEVPLPYSTDFASADALKVWKVHTERPPSPDYRFAPMKWEASNGRLVYTQTGQEGFLVTRLDYGENASVLAYNTVGSRNWKDYEVRATIETPGVLKQGEVGIVFGYQSPARHYRLTFSNVGGLGEIRIERREGDRMAVLDIWREIRSEFSPSMRRGLRKGPLAVRVALAHGRIAVWFDNEQVMNIAEVAIPGGKAGVFAANYDRLETSQFSVRPVSDPKAVAPQPINVLSVEAGAGGIHFNYPKGPSGPAVFLDRDLNDTPWGIDTSAASAHAPPYETVLRFPRGWWARLDRFAIVKCGAAPTPLAPREVEVWTSLTSPFEGFQKVAQLTLSNKEGEETAPLRGVWARYLNLRLLSGHDPDAMCLKQVRAIGTLHAAPPDRPPPLRDDLQEAEINDTPDRANPLPLGKSLAGELASDADRDVFKITVPQEPGDTLQLDVDPRSFGAPALTLSDAAGQTLATVGPDQFVRRPTRLRWKVKPGDYFVTLTRAPASMVMLYDDSDSIQPYLNVVRKLLLTNVEKLAGRMPIKLIRYAGTPDPVTDFTTNPAVLREAIEKGQGGGGGTDTIWGGKAALDALRPRGGNRIIFWVMDHLIIENGEGGARARNFMAFHEQVAREPVRLYILAVGSGLHYDDAFGLYQWEKLIELADRRGGAFFFAPTERETKNIADRILADLVGPTRYALRAEVVKGEPELGEVVVKFVPEAQAIARNLEIILDASGSMNAKLGKSTRWAVARQVLADLVKQLPPDINVSLRVFGHRMGGPASCKDSELLVPPGRVDPSAIIAKVSALRARGETPLVANLLLAGKDLAQAKAGTVVAITDGEESCGGNVQTVAAQLQAQGVQLVVNIVGFNLPNAKAIADWKSVALSTGGRFFDARTAGDLSTALKEAVRLEYVVYDQAGKEVGRAQVGQAVKLPEGTYTVVVQAGQPAKVEGVKVSAKEPTNLTLRRQGAGWSLGPERPK